MSEKANKNIWHLNTNHKITFKQLSSTIVITVRRVRKNSFPKKEYLSPKKMYLNSKIVHIIVFERLVQIMDILQF